VHRARLFRISGLVVGLVLLAAATASTARAMSLADLVAGGSFMATDQPLLFDNFQVTITGALSTDLDDYVVIALEDGFSIVGPIGVVNTFGDILIQYDVWVKDDQRTAPGGIVGASVFFNGAAFGAGSLASVSEDFLAGAGDPIGDLLVFATGVGLADKFDETTFDGSHRHLHVIKDIIVVGGSHWTTGFDGLPCDLLVCGPPTNPGPGLATISLIIERFHVEVTEPVSGSLLGVGLLGLWRLGRRRGSAVA
jgi:hypothetical protein